MVRSMKKKARVIKFIVIQNCVVGGVNSQVWVETDDSEFSVQTIAISDLLAAFPDRGLSAL